MSITVNSTTSSSRTTSGLLQVSAIPESRTKLISKGEAFAHISFLVRINVPEKSDHHLIPLSVAICTDTSSSMAPKDRLPVAIETASFVIKDLARNSTSTNKLSLLSFSSSVRLDMGHTALTPATAPAAIATLSTLKASGCTVLYDAILASINALPATSVERNSAVLLLSDGEDSGSSVGSHGAALAAAKLYNTHVHTIGLGAGHDAVTMKAIANATGGSYASITNPETISDAAAIAISMEQQPRAENVVLSLSVLDEFGPDRRVSIQSVQSLKEMKKCSVTTNYARVEIGQICAGMPYEFLVDVLVPMSAKDEEWEKTLRR